MEIIATSPIVPLITDAGFTGTIRRGMASVRGGLSAASRSVRNCFKGAMCCSVSSRRSNKIQLNVLDREVVTSPVVSLLPPIRKIGDAKPAVPRASTEEDATSLIVSPIPKKREISSFLTPINDVLPEMPGIRRSASLSTLAGRGKCGEGVRRSASVGMLPALTVNDDRVCEYSFMRGPPLAEKQAPAPALCPPRDNDVFSYTIWVWTPDNKITNMYLFNLDTGYHVAVSIPITGVTERPIEHPIVSVHAPIGKTATSVSDNEDASPETAGSIQKKPVVESEVFLYTIWVWAPDNLLKDLFLYNARGMYQFEITTKSADTVLPANKKEIVADVSSALDSVDVSLSENTMDMENTIDLVSPTGSRPVESDQLLVPETDAHNLTTRTEMYQFEIGTKDTETAITANKKEIDVSSALDSVDVSLSENTKDMENTIDLVSPTGSRPVESDQLLVPETDAHNLTTRTEMYQFEIGTKDTETAITANKKEIVANVTSALDFVDVILSEETKDTENSINLDSPSGSRPVESDQLTSVNSAETEAHNPPPLPKQKRNRLRRLFSSGFGLLKTKKRN
uniref:uncharacterized protein LOC104265757 isoform X1 n=1 Tax=Ciona intestinalis TaxID=7719 RepID=UPI000EF4BE0E|nr:uncharacterized protein LOC104265757 isoform X1 [Ciona intestinalis]|eukprot:XP_026690299.1 uncharacterized protein LOC104265757 isoform X1 [Ciona intestinalis]